MKYLIILISLFCFSCSTDPADVALAKQWSGSSFCLNGQKYVLTDCDAVGRWWKISCSVFPNVGPRTSMNKKEILSILKNSDKECP